MNSYIVTVTINSLVPSQVDKSRAMTLYMPTLFDALSLAINKRAIELFEESKKIKEAEFVASAREVDGKSYHLLERVEFKKSGDVKDADEGAYLLPFTITKAYFIKPSKVEIVVLDALKRSYPAFDFFYDEDMGISVRINDESLSIQDYLRDNRGIELSLASSYREAVSFIRLTASDFFKKHNIKVASNVVLDERAYILALGNK